MKEYLNLGQLKVNVKFSVLEKYWDRSRVCTETFSAISVDLFSETTTIVRDFFICITTQEARASRYHKILIHYWNMVQGDLRLALSWHPIIYVYNRCGDISIKCPIKQMGRQVIFLFVTALYFP